MKTLYLKRGGSKTKGVRCLAEKISDGSFRSYHPNVTSMNFWDIDASNSWIRLVRYERD